MNKVILDCDLMRYPDSGLYHYCLNLGDHINKLLDERGEKPVYMYIPWERSVPFKGQACIPEKRWHKFYKPFLVGCRVWHAPFQSGRILPSKNNRHIKVLLTIHDLNTLHEGKSLKEQIKNLAHTQSLINRSDAIVCVSEFVKKDVLNNCDTGSKPVYVIHNGKNVLHFPALSSASYKPERPFLFAIGYVNRKKNYKVLLSLLKENEHIELVIAGYHAEADYVNTIKEEAERLEVSDRLKLLGPVSENEKTWYLSNCTAFMHPSLAEGFGLPVIEAMTFGKPVFLSDKTSLPEIGGDTAFYFSSFDADHMQQVFRSGMKQYTMNGMAKRIIVRGEQFSWGRSAEKYINVYNSLIS